MNFPARGVHISHSDLKSHSAEYALAGEIRRAVDDFDYTTNVIVHVKNGRPLTQKGRELLKAHRQRRAGAEGCSTKKEV